MTKRELENAKCQCKVCRRFREDTEWIKSGNWQRENWVKGECDLCHRKGFETIAPWLPDLLKEFFKVNQICIWCKNGIEGNVGINRYHEGWGLCWQDSPGEALKWAMCDWFRRQHFGHYEFMRVEYARKADLLRPMSGYNDICWYPQK